MKRSGFKSKRTKPDRKCFMCPKRGLVSEMFVDFDRKKVVCDTLECKAKYWLWRDDRDTKARDKAYRDRTKEIAKQYGPDLKKLSKRIQIDIFNPWVRLRDDVEPCISCWKYEHELPPPPVNTSLWHAGHFKSRGHANDKRFNPDNCHKQCCFCNLGSNMSPANEATIAEKYRLNLINKIGAERVDALSFVETHKFTHDELLAIKKEYSAKLKDLKGMQ